MANLFAVHSVGASLATFLRNAVPAELTDVETFALRLFASGELAEMDKPPTSTIGLYLHRITMNEQVRNQRPAGSPVGTVPPVALDLHYLITIWTGNALAEHIAAAWLLRTLHARPILDRSLLSPEAAWRADEVVHVIPAELPQETLSRIWETFRPKYRLSLPFVARVVIIDSEGPGPDSKPVVATRFAYGSPDEVRPVPLGVGP